MKKRREILTLSHHRCQSDQTTANPLPQEHHAPRALGDAVREFDPGSK